MSSDDGGQDGRRAPTDDPRFQRVRRQLVAAVLDLAGSGPAEDLSVSELTAAAGVSRSVFYGHAASPATLLADALIRELRPDLDALAEQMTQPGVDYAHQWRAIYLAVLRHVERHRAVYEILTAQESSVTTRLTGYFEESARVYVEEVVSRLAEPDVPELWKTMAVEQQAHNLLAVIRAWVLTDLADSPEVVVETYLTLAPPWQLARPDEHGRITLRRARTPSGAG